MHIRRDRSSLHFGRQQRRRVRGPLVMLAVALALLAGLGGQFARLAGAVSALLGAPPTPTPSAPTMARQGYAAYLNGDLASAEAAFAEAVRMDPANADYLYEYGHLLLLQGKNEQGLAVAEQIVGLDPTEPRGRALQILALYQLDRLDEAIAIGLAELERGNDFALTYAALAWAYADLGRWERAVEMGERAVALDPNSVDAYRAYAYALTWVGAREQAARALEAAIELHPTLDFLYFELALTYRALQDIPSAIYAYESVLALQPTHTRALLRLCETYFGLREDARAQEYCEQALAIDPTYADAWRAVGQVYYMQGQYQRAIDAFEQCIAHGSDNITCYYVRGLAYYYLGRCDQAVPILQQSLERTQSDQILGFIRQGLRLCEAPGGVPEDEGEPTGETPPAVDGGGGDG